ncbi:aminotransferase class IV [Actinoplanes sp. NPDC048796]|uniref:aminotransferase class IV n=1 Tax=unclassified Actinoplanes TaxID=2626549 RepID=UPI0033D553BF
MTHVEINGAPPSLDAVHRAATWNYGHFSSMQVRNRAVAGLNLHLRRLRAASAVLFPGTTPPADETVVKLIGHALGHRPDASVRVTVLPGPDVMVSVSDPVPDTPRPPLRVRTVVYERELPTLKHVATMGLTYHYREAQRAGFDDALFLGADGAVREGSVWNAVFWDGDRVIWPEAPMLPGITMQLLRQGLEKLGVPTAQRRITSLNGLRAAAAANSHCPAQPLASIDDVDLPEHPALTALLQQAWRAVPWDHLVYG